MKIREYIEKIGENKNIEDMKRLGDMLSDLICEMKESHYELYEKYKMDLYEMAFGKVLSEEMAEEIVTNMKPYHLHWTMEQTNEVMKQMGYNLNPIDFFVTMNMAYNDYHELFGEEVENYARYSKLFIDDPDAKKGKVFTYFMTIPA